MPLLGAPSATVVPPAANPTPGTLPSNLAVLEALGYVPALANATANRRLVQNVDGLGPVRAGENLDWALPATPPGPLTLSVRLRSGKAQSARVTGSDVVMYAGAATSSSGSDYLMVGHTPTGLRAMTSATVSGALTVTTVDLPVTYGPNDLVDVTVTLSGTLLVLRASVNMATPTQATVVAPAPPAATFTAAGLGRQPYAGSSTRSLDAYEQYLVLGAALTTAEVDALFVLVNTFSPGTVEITADPRIVLAAGTTGTQRAQDQSFGAIAYVGGATGPATAGYSSAVNLGYAAGFLYRTVKNVACKVLNVAGQGLTTGYPAYTIHVATGSGIVVGGPVQVGGRTGRVYTVTAVVADVLYDRLTAVSA